MNSTNAKPTTAFVLVDGPVTPRDVLPADRRPSIEFRRTALRLDPSASATKTFVREGIKRELRRDGWLSLLNMDPSDVSSRLSTYNDACLRTFGRPFDARPIPGFVPDFGSERLPVEDHGMRKMQVHEMARVLCCFAANHPRSTFCPALPNIACTLLRHLDEADVYACMCILVQRSEENKWFFRLGREDRLVSLLTFVQCLHDTSRIGAEIAQLFRKHLSAVLNVLGPLFDSILFPWLRPVARDEYPESYMQLVDAFLLEGHKVIYRMALTLVLMNHKELLESSSRPDNLLKTLSTLTLHGAPREAFKKAFSLSLTRSRLADLDQHHFVNLDPSLLGSAQRVRRYIAPLRPAQCLILQERHFEFVWHWLSDDRYRVARPMRVFSTADDGYSFSTFMRKCNNIGPHLIVIQDLQRHIFGAVLSDGWRFTDHFYGTGTHAFLFSFAKSRAELKRTKSQFLSDAIEPETPMPQDDEAVLERLGQRARVYRWQTGTTGNNYLQQALITQGVLIGSGGEGFGLTIDAQLEYGSSAACATFGNKPLCPCCERTGIFVIANIEAFSLTMSGH
jgi:hypothetical protein